MRPVNLIPPEERRGDAAPLRTGPTVYVLLGVLTAALLTVTMLVLTGNGIKDRQAELDSLDARQQAAEATAAELTPYIEFATMTAARDATVTSLAESRFDWERVLRELSLVLPEGATLATVTGSTAAGGGGADNTSTLAAGATGPSLSLQGCADGQKGAAAVAAALHDIDGVTRVGVNSSQVSGDGGAASGDDATCTGANVSQFDIVAVFDGVGAVAATSTTTPPATDSAATDSAATDPATSDAVAEQQQSRDAAVEQTDKARNAANLAPGVDQ